MEAFCRTRKIGGSLVTTIPRDIVEELGIHENETIELEIRKPRKSAFGMFKGFTPFNEKDRVDIRE